MSWRDLLRKAQHRWLWPVYALLVAALVLLPGLGAPGLWEPHEMRVADAAAERADPPPPPAEQPPEAPRAECPKQPPDDAAARTLTPRLAARGVTPEGTSEGDLRLWLGLLGLVTVLAAYGIGARLASPRAGLLGAVILVSFPLMVLQARMLTSELGTAAGATLVVYGLVAASRPARWPWLVLDLIVAAAAIGVGIVVAFLGGGAFLGLLPPLGAVALAGGLGVVILVALARVLGQLLLRAAPRRVQLGRRRPLGAAAGLDGPAAATAAVALLAFAGAAIAAGVLFDQIWDVQRRAPGTREILGASFVPTECWSTALGGVWRANEDIKATYNSMFEQIAFGMFPWSVLAPVALFGLALGYGGEERRHLGRVTLAWAALAWITASVFERKVGFNVYAGFPACAIAIGAWLDDLLDDRRVADRSHLVIGLWVLLGMITIAKDLQTFPEKLTSLLVGGEQIKYPVVRLAGLHLRMWLLVLATLTGLAFALGLWWRRAARWGLPVAIVLAVVTGVFWAQGWQRVLSRTLSSKHVFAVYRDLRGPDDVLGIMGEMGNAPRYYAGGAWETIKGREALLAFLSRPERVFAFAPASELCAIHRAFAGKPYHVLDDSNAKFLLLSNQLGDATDKNPLSTTILRERPPGIETPFSATFDDRIELVGYTMPERVSLREKFQMTLFFRVKKPVAGSWKIFVHFDKPGQPRFQGDHEPIRGRCATSFWQEGDYIVDTFTVEAGDITTQGGTFQVRVGFFTGTSPNWKNMKVTQAPPGAKDDADRVLLGTIVAD